MMNLADTTAMFKNQQRQKQQEFESIISFFAAEYPNTMRALKLIDIDYSRPKSDGYKYYNLVKVENKKMGFVYYVRYRHNGKMLPSKWNTHTNIFGEAERFAREQRTDLIDRYLRSHDEEMFTLMKRFYESGSDYLASEEKRTRQLSDRCRNDYHAVITKKLIPFFKNRHINCFDEVSVHLLDDFQDSLLADGIKPQTVNNNLKALKRIFAYLVRKGIIQENPCDHVHYIPVRQSDQTARGCYELELLNGVFNRSWKDKEAYLLALLIYATGMRNSEIKRITMADILCISGCHFIDIKRSKTESGKRMVPLHETVYRKLRAYAEGKRAEAFLFDFRADVFIRANSELALRLKVSKAELARQHITFYSGRHFWKTLMNREGLGDDVEEIFMGHKVSSDVSKLYNHRDKQGRKQMVKKAKQEFAILDRCLFGAR